MARLDFSKWVQNRLASLVSYANAGTDLAASTVQAAITELANRNFGKNYQADTVVGEISGSGSTILTLNTIVTPNLPSGNYLISYRSAVQKTLVSADVESWIQIGATEINRDLINLEDDDIFLKDQDFAVVNLSGVNTITTRIQKVSGGGNILARNRTLTIWRLN